MPPEADAADCTVLFSIERLVICPAVFEACNIQAVKLF